MSPIIFVLLYLLVSLGVAWWGQNYRFGFWGYFFASLMMTPAVGLLLVIASSPPKASGKNSSADHRNC